MIFFCTKRFCMLLLTVDSWQRLIYLAKDWPTWMVLTQKPLWVIQDVGKGVGRGPWGIRGCSSVTMSHVEFFMRLRMESGKRDSALASGPRRDVDRIHSQQVLLEVGSGRPRNGVSSGPLAVGGISAAELPGTPLGPLLRLLSSVCVCFGPSRLQAVSALLHLRALPQPLCVLFYLADSFSVSLYLWLPVLSEFPI